MEILKNPRIIFDTDMDTDCDDAGALAMVLEAHLAGEAELVGVIADSVSCYAAPCCEAFCRYYGVSVPIGAIYADDYSEKDSDIARFAAYRAHSQKFLKRGTAYNRVFADEIQKKDRDYPAAAKAYRKMLANAPDNSIVIVCVGMLTAAAEALASEPDDISSFSGVELFQRKVRFVVTMGNPDSQNDFNWGMDADSAEHFFALCPVPVYISPEGEDVITGDHLSAFLPEAHPLRRAYRIYRGDEVRGRSSWDLIAVLYALDPQTPYLYEKVRGDCRYVAKEKTFYTEPAEQPMCKTLHLNCSADTMKKVLNAYMLGNF